MGCRQSTPVDEPQPVANVDLTNKSLSRIADHLEELEDIVPEHIVDKWEALTLKLDEKYRRDDGHDDEQTEETELEAAAMEAEPAEPAEPPSLSKAEEDQPSVEEEIPQPQAQQEETAQVPTQPTSTEVVNQLVEEIVHDLLVQSIDNEATIETMPEIEVVVDETPAEELEKEEIEVDIDAEIENDANKVPHDDVVDERTGNAGISTDEIVVAAKVDDSNQVTDESTEVDIDQPQETLESLGGNPAEEPTTEEIPVEDVPEAPLSENQAPSSAISDTKEPLASKESISTDATDPIEETRVDENNNEREVIKGITWTTMAMNLVLAAAQVSSFAIVGTTVEHGIVMYRVQVMPSGEILEKRFNDFKALYTALTHNKTCDLAPLPRAGMLSRFDRQNKALIEARSVAFDSMLASIAHHPTAVQSADFQRFLH
ncbi:hypothetical protein AC1031_011586 [Aphanomyces cochlioides]|nr:hypothetical protein AC1031_011586 [Aphanomyces cochlioides]